MEILDSKLLSQTPGPYKVTEVAFSRYAYGSATGFQAKQFQMRMSHSTAGCPPHKTFMNNCQPCPTNLIDTSAGFNWPVPNTKQWTDIGTVADFGWDGKRSICLEIRYRGHSTSNRLAFYSEPGNCVIPRSWANSSARDNYPWPTADYTYANNGLKCRLTIDKKNVLIAPDSVSIGTSGPVTYVNGPPGDLYQIAASLGQAQQLNLGKCSVFLTIDGVFLFSLYAGPPIFIGYAGNLNALGNASGKLVVPLLKPLVGICVYHAGIAYNVKAGVTGCTNTGGTMIAP